MTQLPRVFVTRRIPNAGLDLLKQHCQVDVWEGDLPPPAEALKDRSRQCQGLLTLLSDRVDEAVMSAAGSQLKVISNYAVGYNNIDVAAATRRGIVVGNTPGALTDATADLAVALLLAAARRIPESCEQVRRHEWRTWEPLGLLGCEIAGATLGILGMGRIGMAVARRLRGGWGVRVIYTARSPKTDADRELQAEHVSLESLLEQSDFISVHCDLNPTTRHLLNEETLSRMKPGAILINTSRGGVIDQLALADALSKGRPWAAALDVTDPEPLPAGHPLWNAPRCLIVPHIGSATKTARDQMAILAANNLLCGLQDKPLPHPVGSI